jgi:hypothetical protein
MWAMQPQNWLHSVWSRADSFRTILGTNMEYLIGVLLAVTVALFGLAVGFDRERSYYAVVLVVVGSYYVLFAAIDSSRGTLLAEITISCAFTALAVLGYRTSAWFLVAGLVGHGVFDSVHHWFIQNPGVPRWWPGFCLSFDVVFGAFFAARLLRRGAPLSTFS